LDIKFVHISFIRNSAESKKARNEQEASLIEFREKRGGLFCFVGFFGAGVTAILALFTYDHVGFFAYWALF
jgi:hypothetical protein